MTWNDSRGAEPSTPGAKVNKTAEPPCYGLLLLLDATGGPLPVTRWIQTYRGRQFFPLAPRPTDLDVVDIAHALSLQCRFNGHCRVFYSVAEHSVRVARLLAAQGCSNAISLWGLLHDAAEAYLGDLPSPIKRELPTFQQAEEAVLRLVADRFELCWPMPAEVHEADLRLLATEARDLMAAPPAPWEVGAEPIADRIEAWTAEHAEEVWLEELRARNTV